MPIDKERVIDTVIGAGDPPNRKFRHEPEKSRRDFLKWGLTGLAVATVTGFALNNQPRNVQKTDEATKYADEGQAAIENNQPLETKFFANEIVHASVRTIPLAPQLDMYEVLGGIFLGTTLGQTVFRYKPEIFNRLIGLGAGLTARTIDDISTFIAAAALNDKRVKEYGLDAYFYEENSQLPADLTPQSLIDSELVSTLELAGITIAFPLIGKIYLASAPFVFKNNVDTAQAIVNSLNIGDQVEALIQDGKSGEDILTFLNNVGKDQAQINPQPATDK